MLFDAWKIAEERRKTTNQNKSMQTNQSRHLNSEIRHQPTVADLVTLRGCIILWRSPYSCRGAGRGGVGGRYIYKCRALGNGETMKSLCILPHGASVSVRLAAAVLKGGKGSNLT